MHHSQSEEFLAVDVGDKRVGLARGSTTARLAEPLKTVDSKSATAEIARLVSEHKAAGVVVGLPRNLDGADTAQTEKVRQWVERAKKDIQADFYWQDEAATSLAAEKTGGDDAHAAAIILQDFLNGAPEERLRC